MPSTRCIAAMWAWARQQTLDLTPPTDARPFSRTRTATGELALGAPESVLGLCDTLFGGDAEHHTRDACAPQTQSP